MIVDLGTVTPGSTLRVTFDSYSGTDGSSITMTDFAVSDILIYKDGSTTERASTSGYTATTDFDSKTGKQLVAIDLADNTTAGFYAAGSEYLVAIDTVTIDGAATGGWLARFKIGYEGASLNTTIASLSSQTSFTLTNGPAEDDALNGRWAIIHDVASSVQCAWVQIIDYTGSTKTVTLASAGTYTVATTDNFSLMGPMPVQATVIGRTLDVTATGAAGIDWGNVENPTTTVSLSGTTVKTATDVETGTADIQSRLPAALVGGRIDANVGAISGDSTAADNLESYTDGTTPQPVNSTHFAGTPYATALAAEVDAIWDEPLTAAAHNVANSAGRRLRTITPAMSAIHEGTCQSGSTANTIVLDTSASSTNGTYDPAMVIITDGTGAGQVRFIIDYVGSTRTATIARDWRTTPDNTSVFAIIPEVNLLSTNEGRSAGGSSTTITLNSSASSVDDTYNGQTVVLRTGTGQDQARIVVDYNGTTKVATVGEAWATNPDTTTGYMMLHTGRAYVTNVTTAAANEIAAAVAVDATLDTRLDTIDTAIAAVKSDTAAILLDTGTDGVIVATNNDKTNYRLSATGLSDIGTAILTTALTESYAADGAAPTLAQAIFAIQQMMQEKSISSTTMTVRRLDGSTAAMTFTLNDATNPTSITRAS